jgi:hypothetical protein
MDSFIFRQADIVVIGSVYVFAVLLNKAVYQLNTIGN